LCEWTDSIIVPLLCPKGGPLKAHEIRTQLCHHQHLASRSPSTLTPDTHNVVDTDILVTTRAHYQSLYLPNQSPSATYIARKKELGSVTTAETSARRLREGQRCTTSKSIAQASQHQSPYKDSAGGETRTVTGWMDRWMVE
jgi:hypothetical protein